MTDAGVEQTSPVVRRVRAYFAPGARGNETATVFDPAQSGRFDVDAPPAGWLDLGWVYGFKRASGTKVEALRTGAPAVVATQVRAEIEATVALEFGSWGKLQMALACGTQQMNLLRAVSGAAAIGAVASGCGGAALPAVALVTGSTATVLQMSAGDAAGFAAGDLVAVDVDYAGQTGYVGSGASAAYVRSALSDTDYVRRVTLNVARVTAVDQGALTMAVALPAGAPVAGMKVSGVVGFCDREGSSFFQEWSGLFVMDGQQGDRVVLFYPRLQTMTGIAEASVPANGFETVRLAGSFRALPVKDAVDGEQVVCFRSYLAA